MEINMGCCEIRDFSDQFGTPVAYNRGAVKTLLSYNDESMANSNSDRDPIMISEIGKLIDTEEPELYVAMDQIEEMSRESKWTVVAEESFVSVRYVKHCEKRIIINSSIYFPKLIPCQLILRLLNCPESRLIWDHGLSEMKVLDGDKHLDATLNVCSKGNRQVTGNRYVREYKENLISMFFEDEPEVKTHDNWLEDCSSFEITSIWLFHGSTVIDVFFGLKDSSPENAIEQMCSWSQVLYSEVMFQMPKH